MNARTTIILSLILIFCLLVTVISIFGPLLPSSVNARYIRQSAAEREVEGGGTLFGK